MKVNQSKMETILVQINDNKAYRLLKDLEDLQLIKLLEKSIQSDKTGIDRITKYKGAMSKQPLQQVDQELNELRKEWE